MSQSLFAVYIHLVFSTKERRALLPDSIRTELHAYLGGVLKERKSIRLSINSMPDHIHLLFSLPRTIAIAKMVEDIKTTSSKWIKSRKAHPCYFNGREDMARFPSAPIRSKQCGRISKTNKRIIKLLIFRKSFCGC